MPDDPKPEEDAPKTDDKPVTTTTDWEKEAEKWKALARKHEGSAKSNATAATRLAEIEAASKSEQEKAADTARTATERADKAERELLRLRVASEKGLTASQAKRLQGDTEDDLRADADELVAEFKPSATGSTTTRKPSEDLRGGGDPDAPAVELDPDKLAASISAQG